MFNEHHTDLLMATSTDYGETWSTNTAVNPWASTDSSSDDDDQPFLTTFAKSGNGEHDVWPCR